MDETLSKDQAASEKFFTKPILIIFVTILIDLIGFGMLIPVLPYYVKSNEFHATPFEIGMLFAVFSVMQFIFSPILGSLSDKYGRRPILFFSLLGTCAAALITGLSTTLWMIFIGRMLDGMTGGNISTAQAYIADVTTKENRAKGMGLIGAAFGLGFVLGPAIGGILSQFGTHVPFFFVSGLAFCNAVSLYFVLPESRKFNEVVEVRKGRMAEIFDSLTDPSFGIVTLLYFLVIVAFSIMTTAFAQYTMFRFNYDAAHNGYLFAYIGVLAVVIQGGIFAKLVKKLGETTMIIIGCVLLAGSFFAVPYVGPDFGGLTALLIGIACFAIGNSFCSPALTSLASKQADEREQGKALGVLQSAASLARAIGPAMTSFLLYSAIGPDNISDSTLFRTFWTASSIMVLSLFVSFYLANNTRKQVLA